MNNYSVVLDPILFIWDRNRIAEEESIYWGLAIYLSDVLELFDNCEYASIAMREVGALQIIESFPADAIDYGNAIFRDVARMVYGFVGSHQRDHEFSDQVLEQLSPDYAERAHFTDEIRREVHSTAAYVLDQNLDPFVVTRADFWESGESSVQVRSQTNYAEFCVLQSTEECVQVIQSRRRVYEENAKHAVDYGWGSRLPDCLDDTHLQLLLDRATAVSKDQTLMYVYSKTAECFVVFRQHVANKYHGYPVAVDELSRIGASATKFPSF